MEEVERFFEAALRNACLRGGRRGWSRWYDGKVLIGAERPRRGGAAKRGAPLLVSGDYRVCTCSQLVCMANQCLVILMPALPAGSSVKFMEVKWLYRVSLLSTD